MEERYRLVQDDDCHWYLIPFNQEKVFREWVEDWNSEDDFDKYRLNSHLSCYAWRKPEKWDD